MPDERVADDWLRNPNPRQDSSEGSAMHHTEQLERLRATVRENLKTLEPMPVENLQETILIRDGFYCGRRFRAESVHAIWFLEENQLKFFGADGRVVKVVCPAIASEAIEKRAA